MTYRVGNHNPRNLYRDDEHFGVVFDPADGPLVVEALNERAARQPRVTGAPVCEHGYQLSARAFEAGLPPVHMATGKLCGAPDKPVISEREGPVDHRASSLGGDGLGYGPCVGCGELWPCKASR